MSTKVEDAIRQMQPVKASTEQQAILRDVRKLLDEVVQGSRKATAPKCELLGPQGQRIALPEAVFYALERVVEVLASGDAVTVVPIGKMITTQQAADLLNVSRQYLVRLLDEKKIPYTRTGKHRRLRIEDVTAYKERRDRERRVDLKTLTEMSEDFGGYPELK